MKNLIKIYRILCLPAIIWHELTHVIISFLVGCKILGISFPAFRHILTFTEPDKSIPYAYVNFCSKSKFQSIMISFSTIIFLILFISLSYKYLVFRYIVIYLLFAFGFSIPSKYDIKAIKEKD